MTKAPAKKTPFPKRQAAHQHLSRLQKMLQL